MKMNNYTYSLFTLMAMASTAAAFAPPHAITTTTTTKTNHFPQTYAHTNTRPNSIPSSSSSPFSIHTHTPLLRRHPHARTSTSSSSSTRMNMMAPAASGTSAVMGVISGGILGGALHAIAGPDHLAALLPKCCGQKWYRAGRIGALWGMGHGVSATILGLTAFGLKNRIASMPGVKGALIGASSVMEVAVGASLIFIGLLGIKEAREFGEEDDSIQSTADDVEVEKAQKRAVIFNGILHGFSWDGAPSLAPALAVATWRGSISFLLAYAVGTMGAMSITTTLIGESTRRAGKIFHKPDLPQKLSVISSFLAMAVGIFWCYIAFK